MPGRQQIPSFQLPSGTTAERDNSYNLTTVGNIFFNTDTSNVEIRHEDPTNNTAWRDLVVNNREIVDISGNLKYSNVRFFAYDLTGTVNVGAGSVIAFESTTFNDNSCYASGIFTPPIHGIYRFSIAFFMTASGWNQVAFHKKANNAASWSLLKTSNAATPVSDDLIYSAVYQSPTSLTFMLELNGGDKIRPIARPNRGTVSVYLPHSFFCGELISAL